MVVDIPQQQVATGTSVCVCVQPAYAYTIDIGALEDALLRIGQSIALKSDGYDRGEDDVRLWLYSVNSCDITEALIEAARDWEIQQGSMTATVRVTVA